MHIQFNMRITLKHLLTTASLILGLSQTLDAQIAVHEFNVRSINYGVKSKFTFTVDPTSNTLTVVIDNTIAGVNGFIGTITGFGFNTPFSDAQLGTNGSNVWHDQTVFQLISGHAQPEDWVRKDPFSLSIGGGSYSQDFGVWAPNPKPQNGIKHGEKAWFVFAFPDFTPAQVGGFFNSSHDLTVRYQEVENAACDGYSDVGWTNDTCLPVPEPSTYGLMGAAGLLGLVAWRKRQQKK